ncbi:MAG: hypothetical protein A3H98_13485 [Bacteroidetes bacterium RIFCSPLOWO2_02_FULL_36_8]|nr:MAG: hypothetical protein A3H98_13485 [Bacteroidetes bacterium RIFCSPLOWO2_02_FULL_36_8]OFY71769.1 MAG: hypothetical protein A3G23_13705 [Bacteroidetes bacterium RIFCSPLOWO2_12_FULL_37_12]
MTSIYKFSVFIILFFIQGYSINLFSQSPENDLCNNAIVLCPDQPITADNINAKWESINDPCNRSSTHKKCGGSNDISPCFFIDNSVWFRFTTNSSGGPVNITITNIKNCHDSSSGNSNTNGLQAMLLRFNGTPCSNATIEAIPSNPAVPNASCFDNPLTNTDDMFLSGTLLPNTNYYILIDGAGDSLNPTYCNFTINLNPSAGVDACEMPPEPEFSVLQNRVGCSPYLVQFLDQSLNSPNSFRWDFGDPASGNNNTDTVPNPIHLFANPGFYSVKLVVKNNFGSDSLLKTNYFEVIASPTINSISSDTTICKGDTISINVVAQGKGVLSYQWSPAKNISNILIPNPYVFPTDSVVYKIIVKDNTILECITNDSVTLNVINLEKANGGNDKAICPPSTKVQLTAFGGNYYRWSPATGLSDSTISNPIANPSQATSYIVFIKDTVNQCSISAIVNVFISSEQVIATAGTDQISCEGDSISLHAKGGENYVDFPSLAIPNYRWEPAEGLNDSFASDPRVLVNSQKEYVVFVSNGLCVDTDTVTVTPLTITVNTLDNNDCQPLITSFQPEINISTDSVATWEWNFGNGKTSSEMSPVNVVYSDSGSFDVGLTVKLKNGCLQTFTNKSLIRVFPTPEISIKASPRDPFLKDSVKFISSTKNTTDLIWDMGDGNTMNGMFFKYLYSDTGKYTLKIIASNQFGCRDTFVAENYIYVTPDLWLYFPTAFTPNNDNLNEEFSVVGQIPTNYLFSYTIYDRWGKPVFTGDWYTNRNWNGRINNTGPKVLPGVYTYVILIVDNRKERLVRGGVVTVIY